MQMRSDLAALRVRKDVNELSKAKFTCSQVKTRVEFPDGVDNMFRIVFSIAIADLAGPYANGDFVFYVEIPKTYPFYAPAVTCLTRVWHPNVDLHTGRVMMPILGSDWRPVLSINTVLLGLQLVFLEPGLEYAMNQQAAELLHQDPAAFRDQVQKVLCGGKHFGVDFPEHPRVLEKRRQVNQIHMKRSRDSEEESSRLSDSKSSVASRIVFSSSSMPDGSLPMWKRMRYN